MLNLPKVLLSFLFLTSYVSVFAECPCENIYVWRFSDLVSNSNFIEETYSDLFEEILTERQSCKVLERRKYATILDHEENEKKILGIDDFNAGALKKLGTIKADIVVIGSITEGVDSLNRVVRIKFINIFTKEVYINKSVSKAQNKLNSHQSIKTILVDLLNSACGEMNSIEKIILVNHSDDAEIKILNLQKILVDVDSLTVQWIPKGIARDIEICLENIVTGERTNRVKVNSIDSELIFECNIRNCIYRKIMSNRLPGETNRIRAIIFDGTNQFISKEFDVYVGLVMLVLGEKPNTIRVTPLIDNTSVKSVTFEAELIIFGYDNSIVFEEKKKTPECNNKFILKRKILKKIDWDKIILFPNCYREGIDDRMIRMFYAMDQLKY